MTPQFSTSDGQIIKANILQNLDTKISETNSNFVQKWRRQMVEYMSWKKTTTVSLTCIVLDLR